MNKGGCVSGSQALSVCLWIALGYSKSNQWIWMKFYGDVLAV